MNKEQEIGNVFRESLQGYKAEPPAELWSTIAQDKTLLKFNRRKRLWRMAKLTALPLAGLIAVIIISTVMFPEPPKGDSRATTPETAIATPATSTVSPSSPIQSAPVTSGGNSVANLPAPRPHSNINVIQPAESKEMEISDKTTSVVETPASRSEATDNLATNTRPAKLETKTSRAVRKTHLSLI